MKLCTCIITLVELDASTEQIFFKRFIENEFDRKINCNREIVNSKHPGFFFFFYKTKLYWRNWAKLFQRLWGKKSCESWVSSLKSEEFQHFAPKCIDWLNLKYFFNLSLSLLLCSYKINIRRTNN